MPLTDEKGRRETGFQPTFQYWLFSLQAGAIQAGRPVSTQPSVITVEPRCTIAFHLTDGFTLVFQAIFTGQRLKDLVFSKMKAEIPSMGSRG